MTRTIQWWLTHLICVGKVICCSLKTRQALLVLLGLVCVGSQLSCSA